MLIDKFVSCFSGSLSDCGRYRMYDAYRSVSHNLYAFCDNRVPTLRDVYTKGFLLRYQEYLTHRGCKRNTISFYMTTLRSIYHYAVRMKKVTYRDDLFSEVFTGSDPTVKRALDSDSIALLHVADLSAIPRLERCRDLFMLSLHLQGMPFADLARLRKSDLEGDLITYRRRKTCGFVQVSVSEPARLILDKYVHEAVDSPYLLPLLTLSGADGYKEYQTVLHRHNRQLKSLALHLGIKHNLSSYVARHSWATLAHHNGVDVSIVSQAMGHKTEEITHVYLSSFAMEKFIMVNRAVYMAILRPIEEGRVEPIVVQSISRINSKRSSKVLNDNTCLSLSNAQLFDSQLESVNADSDVQKDGVCKKRPSSYI